jgi:hypothetical protein
MAVLIRTEADLLLKGTGKKVARFLAEKSYREIVIIHSCTRGLGIA